MAAQEDAPDDAGNTSAPGAAARTVPIPGQIAHVRGRGPAGAKGLPAVSELDLELPDGITLEFRQRPSPDAISGQARVIAGIPARNFSHCPICLTPDPTSREHVPPETLGGQIMTRTCDPCNKDLGSRLEAALVDWYDMAFVRVTFEGEGVRGRRRSARLLYRETPDGKFGLIPDTGKSDPAIEDILHGDEFAMTHTPLDKTIVQLAALKSAYLAACLHLGRVPETPSAKQIRADLLAARDAPKGSHPTSTAAAQVKLWRTYADPNGPVLALLENSDATEFADRHLISLAGTVIVSWPFPEMSPIAH
ncbi:hypothetical protein J5X84_39365 [Streptosporangiaceae bacterium NEAU-GS5]|nr:hypothetical protein [Streptosporangiaceae bacterium NEAU-GS5]